MKTLKYVTIISLLSIAVLHGADVRRLEIDKNLPVPQSYIDRITKRMPSRSQEESAETAKLLFKTDKDILFQMIAGGRGSRGRNYPLSTIIRQWAPDMNPELYNLIYDHHYQNNPFLYAIERGNNEVVQYFLNQDRNLANLKYLTGESPHMASPLELAIATTNEKTVETLHRLGAEVNDEIYDRFWGPNANGSNRRNFESLSNDLQKALKTDYDNWLKRNDYNRWLERHIIPEEEREAMVQEAREKESKGRKRKDSDDGTVDRKG